MLQILILNLLVFSIVFITTPINKLSLNESVHEKNVAHADLLDSEPSLYGKRHADKTV